MEKIILPFLALLLTSCAVTNYYQVYKTNTDNGLLDKNKIVFEDNNCSVYYNLWAEGGNVGFNIYNKTKSDLTVDLTKTFFVLNGVAYEYYQNRTFSKLPSSWSALTTYNSPHYYYWHYNPSEITGTNSTSFSISYIEKQQLTIPPKTQANVSEYQVVSTRYINCDLLKYPTSNTIKTVKFDKSNSPFVFYNLITYYTNSDTLRLENKFYVSEITNYPSTEMYTYIYTSACGKKLEFPIEVFKNVTPDKFYIKYTRKK